MKEQKTQTKKISFKEIKIKSYEFLKKNYKELIILLGILLVGGFFRLYKISEYMTFLGDEGRDAIIVRRFLVDFDLMLIGPGTSVGNMYLGPLYYYFTSIGLWLANFSPEGPSIQVAIVGILTIAFVYWVGREWFSKRAGAVAAGLYAIAPTTIIFSRSSWNPNIMPFFSTLAIYSIWRVWKKDQYNWILVSAISCAFVLQSHYLGLLILPVVGIFWIMIFLVSSAKSQEIDDKAPVVKFIKISLFSLVAFLFLMSPLLIFDVRHNWMNYNAMKTFFAEKSTVSTNLWDAITKLPNILNNISTRLLAGRMESLGKIIVAVVSIPSILLLLGRKRLHRNEASGFMTLTLWMVVGLIGLGLYNQSLHDHYFGFLFTAPFLFLGGFLDGIFENLSKIGKTVLVAAFLFVVYVNLTNNPLKYPPNKQMQRAQEVAEKIELEAGGEQFNLAVLAERNYEDGYGYFLEKAELIVLHADTWNEDTISDQLFVVCEMAPEKCDPTHSPKAEVVNFGWTDIESTWEVMGVTIYKLVHSKKIE